MGDNDGLICAYHLDGKGHGQEIGWDALAAPPTEGAGFLWIHIDRSKTRAADWLLDDSGLDPLVSEALLAEETRPRTSPFEHGFLVNLRGINLAPESDPEDMVALRIWLERGRVITVRQRRLHAIDDIRAAIDRGRAPQTVPGFFVKLADLLEQRIEPVIDALEERLDALEEAEQKALSAQRAELADIRRGAIVLRRHVSPQREALLHLANGEVKWLTPRHRQHIREVADDITRHIENLNLVWERAAVLRDELANRIAEQTNQRLYVLAMVASIFLPLGFVTGLLGINVGGIPLADSQYGFAAVAAVLLGVGGVELVVFRRLGWI